MLQIHGVLRSSITNNVCIEKITLSIVIHAMKSSHTFSSSKVSLSKLHHAHIALSGCTPHKTAPDQFGMVANDNNP